MDTVHFDHESSLIEAVRDLPVLYNSSLKEHNNEKLAEFAWFIVMIKARKTIDWCQRRWKRLYNRMQTEYINQLKTSFKKPSEWRHFTKMRFLAKSFVVPKKLQMIQMDLLNEHQVRKKMLSMNRAKEVKKSDQMTSEPCCVNNKNFSRIIKRNPLRVKQKIGPPINI